MKCVSIAFAVCAVVTGIIAAYFWHQSSTIQIDPGWTREHPEPVVSELRQMDLNVAHLPDQCAQVCVDLWPTCQGTGLPTPVPAEAV